MKSCPFCGKQPEERDCEKFGNETAPARVECRNQSCRVRPMAYGASLVEAAGRWNTREGE